MSYIPRLKEEYKGRVVKALTEEFSYSNVMQVPKLQKIVVSKGVGAAIADKKLIDYADHGAGNPLDLITDDVIDRYAIAGSPERCKERIARLVDAGVNSFILIDHSNYGAVIDIESTMRVFQEKIMPEFL